MNCRRIYPVKAVVFFIVSVCLVLVFTSAGLADVRLPAIIGDNMVLQQAVKAPIWGWAEPGEDVTVKASWQESPVQAKAGRDGKWMAKIDTPKAGGPYEITIKAKNTITLKNVLVGEVWIASGQSNMEFAVNRTNNSRQEIADARYPNIRLFTVKKKVSAVPQSDCVGEWQVCGPNTISEFSAVAYFFGRELHGKLNVPVGLIHTSWGGTPAEAWTRAEALGSLADFKGVSQQIKEVQANPEKLQKEYDQALLEWTKKFNALDAGYTGGGRSWADVDVNDTAWAGMDIPRLWETGGLPDFDGVVWFRKVVQIPQDWVGRDMVLELGPIDDEDITFVNGMRVGGLEGPGYYDTVRKYKLPATAIKAGANVIAVRVLDTGGGGGLYGKSEQLKIYPVAKKNEVISLAGQWRYKVGCDLKSVPPRPRMPLSLDNQNSPTVLYNAMLAPLIPYAIKGAIWYQGESNAGRAYQYRELFPAMIKCWRDDWGRGDFAFLFVQLANYMAASPEPVSSDWAELREAQLMTLSLPNTGMAVVVDIGEANDIHPRNKQDVGRRLALWALVKNYGQKLVYSGPIYKSMKIDGSKIILHFEHVGGGLVAAGGPLKGFAVAGADRKFVWADAKIDGDSVVVSSEKVANPVAVRYAWANNPVCNLYNKETLPASPFRTDDWPGITADKK